MSNLTHSRRRFLQSLGISAATIPFVVGLDSLYAKAAVTAVPKKRFIHMYTPNGGLYYNQRLRVHGTVTDISDGAALAAPNLIYHPLQANASKLLVLDRLSYIGADEQYQNASASPDKIDHPGGHQKGMGNMLTGQVLIGGSPNPAFVNSGLANGISVDQVLATKLFTGVTKFPSIEVGIQTDQNLSDRYVDKRSSYNGPASPRAPQNDPFQLFSTLFGGSSMSASAQSQRSMLDKSVLDSSLDDFAALTPKLSSSDNLLLQQHASAIRDLELQLGTVVNCGAETPPATPAGVSLPAGSATLAWAMLPANYPAVGTMMMNIIAQALACGLTNIVTLLWSNSENDRNFPFLPNVLNTALGHHGMSHARDPGLVAIDQWHATQFNTLINLLTAIPDSGTTGTLLDNSLLMWSSCLGDASSHFSNNVPVVLAGSNNGYFNTGKNIQFNDTYTAAQWAGDPLGPLDGAQLTTAADLARTGDQQTVGSPNLSNSDLAVSILNSFGMPDTTFGDPRFCHGALPHVKVGS